MSADVQRKKSSYKSTPQGRSQTAVFFALHFRVLAGVALIVVSTFIAYFPSINGGFIWDDEILLTKNSLVNTQDGLQRILLTTEPIDYWPATNSTFWFEWRLWSMCSTGYHITNLVLHIAASLLIWAILRKLSISGAFLAAWIFALHPVNVESVAWIRSGKTPCRCCFSCYRFFGI